MEKKNTMLLTIIAVATLLVAVVGATFAYFTAQNGASGSTTATVTTETIGAITVSNEDPALYLDLTAAQMQEGVTGSYWATKIKGAEPATNYASADKAVIAKLNVSGGDETTTYSCNFKITVDKTDVTLAYGDAAVVFALENNAEILGVTSGSEIDYTTLLNEYIVNFTRIGDTEEDLPLVSVSMRVTNTEVEQGFAGETLTTTFTSSDLECEVVDDSDVKTLSGTWQFNEELIGDSVEENVNFNFYGNTSDEFMLTGCKWSSETGEFSMNIVAPSDSGYEIAYTSTDGWLDNSIRAITFSEEQVVSEEFYTWFINNAVSFEGDKLSGTWILNETLSQPVQMRVNFSLETGDVYNVIGNGWTNNVWSDVIYGNVSIDDNTINSAVVAYKPTSGWMAEEYRTITFAGEQEVVPAIWDWFMDNAKPVIEVYELPTENIDTSAIYKTYEYTAIDSTNSTTIKAGTYRFNDVLNGDFGYTSQTIQFTFTENVVVSQEDAYQLNQFSKELEDYQEIKAGTYIVTRACDWMGGTDTTSFGYAFSNATTEPVNNTLSLWLAINSSNGGNDTTIYYPGWEPKWRSEEAKIITIAEDQEVSSEFGTWFIANAKLRGDAKYHQFIDDAWVEQ